MRSGKFIFFGAISVLAILGGVAMLFLGSGDSLISDSTKASTAAFTKKPAPDFEIELFTGETIKLSDYKGDKPVVVNFWASWCGPCRGEADILAKTGLKYKDKVEFIGIATNDNQRDAKTFLKEFDITYANGLDVNNIAINYNITGIPTTFFIDVEGNIVDYWVGAIGEQDLIDKTDKLL